jgi:endonuclease V-like protein UPF0215 family
VPAGRPHLIGIDDGPFAKGVDREVPLVAVFMEGADLVEGVAIERFPVDGDGVSEFLARWISAVRFRPAAQGLVFGGLTIAGLAVIDPTAIASATGLPVLVVNRRPPEDAGVADALRAAGLAQRVATLTRAPRSVALESGLHVAFAGTDEPTAKRLLACATRKSLLPEPLRVAHLIAAALARGESRGRP